MSPWQIKIGFNFSFICIPVLAILELKTLVLKKIIQNTDKYYNGI